MNYRTVGHRMTLQELKHWIETLPSEADDYEIIFANIEEQYDSGDVLVKFTPVMALAIEEGREEILIMP